MPTALQSRVERWLRSPGGLVVEEYVKRLNDWGVIAIDDPADAFTLLYSSANRDLRTRVLLGEDAPDERTVSHQATTAAQTLLTPMAPQSDLSG